MELFLRPTVIVGETIPDDYVVIHLARTVGRVRLATERSPPFWTYSIRVPLPVPPYATGGGAPDPKGAKAAFQEARERFYSGLSPNSIEHFGTKPRTRQKALGAQQGSIVHLGHALLAQLIL
ncbi:hypothetical protein [Bradyrhizobium pachyrhizi]|uniref:hypothetical protein n=1 Tax=Bradyrhizobium pachyrhizi TaxID=280333 RepID=UPI003D3616EA